MDVRSIIANSVQEPGFHRQQRARTRLPSPTGFASAIPWDLVGVRSSDHRRAGPAAAIPTGGDLVGVPSMVGKSIIADRVCICDPMGPGWSSIDHRRAGPAAIPTGGDLVGCSIDHRRPGQQQESPREGTWLEFDRVISAEPCLHTSVERVTMSTHIGRTCDYVYTHRSRVYRPGRSKESLSSVRTVPIGGDRSKGLRGTQDNSAFHRVTATMVSSSNSRSRMRSQCVRLCVRNAFGN